MSKRSPGLLKPVVALSFAAVLFLSLRQTDTGEGALLAKQYCSSCHLPPAPETLTKYVWQFNVLPVMASYLGIQYLGHDPYAGLASDEAALVRHLGTYPDHPIIDETTWQKIVAYYVDNAPATSPIDSARRHRNQPLSQFSTKPVRLTKTTGSFVTAVAYDTLHRELWVAEPKSLYRWHWTKGLTHQYDLPSTVVNIEFRKTDCLLTDIGTLLPSEQPAGNLLSLANDNLTPVKTAIHRPVYTLSADVNNDGMDELISACFGHRSGSLSLYVRQSKSDSTHTETVLLNKPGAVKCYVRDMNGDGRKDIVALFAQGEEAIWVFYQQDNLQFTPERIMQFGPQFGTSDFVLLDYNRDGITDLAVVHGDNADYSYCLKPFHGLRVLLGDGNRRYTDAFFYPIYGATRLQADDFDQDGDVDFAVSAFFPELTYLASESFVYLENVDSDAFRFTTQVLDTPVPIKSLTLEKADVDQDGDQDLILGQFSYSPVPVPPALQKAWSTVDHKVLILVNQRRK